MEESASAKSDKPYLDRSAPYGGAAKPKSPASTTKAVVPSYFDSPGPGAYESDNKKTLKTSPSFTMSSKHVPVRSLDVPGNSY